MPIKNLDKKVLPKSHIHKVISLLNIRSFNLRTLLPFLVQTSLINRNRPTPSIFFLGRGESELPTQKLQADLLLGISSPSPDQTLQAKRDRPSVFS